MPVVFTLTAIPGYYSFLAVAAFINSENDLASFNKRFQASFEKTSMRTFFFLNALSISILL
jgi:hypothetical protein